MVAALFDTNILIDHLKGIAPATQELAQYSDGAVSIITWIEVLVGATAANEAGVRALLQRSQIIGIEPDIAEEAARIRRFHRVRLPDAVIWASARCTGRLLVTRNTKDFPAGDPGVRHPYVV